MRMIK